MKEFFLGALFGLLFSIVALVVIKTSSVAFMPQIKGGVFLVGAGLMGGLINLLLGKKDVSTQ